METDEKITVESPCIGVCELDKSGDMCAGCLRTVAELIQWTRLTESEKRNVLAKVAERRAARQKKA